jgi:hypothetical protein
MGLFRWFLLTSRIGPKNCKRQEWAGLGKCGQRPVKNFCTTPRGRCNMPKYPPQNRRRCSCGKCPRCQSKLTDNYDDLEVAAYNWLKQHNVGGWAINNVTKLVNGAHTVIEFAEMKGMR